MNEIWKYRLPIEGNGRRDKKIKDLRMIGTIHAL